jgi:hypothetical protein
MMKRLVAIPLLLMMLFSGITVQIASHYCKGSYSGSKVSLDGQLASCGMENLSVTHSSEDIMSSHCCSDIISSVAFSTNYISTACHDLPDPQQEIIHISFISNELLASREICFPLASGSVRPPGILNRAGIEQQVLCIFRI